MLSKKGTQISFASSAVSWTEDKANYRPWQRVESVAFSYKHNSLLSCDPKKTSAIKPWLVCTLLSLFGDLLAFVCQRKHSGLCFKFFLEVLVVTEKTGLKTSPAMLLLYHTMQRFTLITAECREDLLSL